MEKDFVPYEQALALKELGFDEPCFCIYNREKVLRFNNLNNPNDRNKGIKLTSNNGRYPAPLYQQAFRWFRETYKLHTWITSKTVEEGTVYIPHGRTIPDTTKKELVVDIIPYTTFRTPEEAELECLKKLIQIVNEKI